MKRFFFPTIILLLFVSCQKDVYYIISTTVNPKDAGSVSVSPAGPSVLEGTSVTVTAQPKGEYVFTGWSGSLSGTDNPKTISVTSDLNITANFALKEYPLSISVEGEGAVSEKVISTKTDYTSGTIVELTAKAADHWLFDHWEGDLNGNTNPVQITLSSAKTVKAVFVKKMYDLSIEIQGEGTVEEAVVQTKATSYQEGTVVELTAIPADYWAFDHWERDVTGTDNPTFITISDDASVKAVFVEHDPGIVFTDTEYLSPEKMAKKMGLGIALACGFGEVVDGVPIENRYGNGFVTQQTFDKYREAGIKTARIPIAWMSKVGPAPDYLIDKEYLDRVAEVVEYAENVGMNAIININTDEIYEWLDLKRGSEDLEFRKGVSNQLSAMWKQISRRFRDKGDFLIFESFSELWVVNAPCDLDFNDSYLGQQAIMECFAEWCQVFVDAVRSTGGNNASRWLTIPSPCASIDIGLARYDLPRDYVSNNRFLYSFHYYEPVVFTDALIGQWGHTATVYTEETLRYSEEYVIDLFSKVKTRFVDRGIPVYMGEFGCGNQHDERNLPFQLYYFEFVSKVAKENFIAPMIWEDGIVDFVGIFNRATGEYIGFGDRIMEVLNRAIYNDDPAYTIQSVYENAPFNDNTAVILSISDPVFNQYLIDNYDFDKDGLFSVREAHVVEGINVSTDNITSLEGIEQFISLKSVIANGSAPGKGKLISLNLSNNNKLEEIALLHNAIHELNMGECPQLRCLLCWSNELTNLDLSLSPQLKVLACAQNQITSLDFSLCPFLREVAINDNLLTSIDVTCLPNLEILECGGNLIKELDVSKCPNLKQLNTTNSPFLTKIILAEGQTIDYLEKDSHTAIEYKNGIAIGDAVFERFLLEHFDQNQDGIISLSEAAEIRDVEVSTDSISTVQALQHAGSLTRLSANGTWPKQGQLTRLDMSHNPLLDQLFFLENNVSDLNINGCTKLVVLACWGNNLSELDVTHCPELEVLYCAQNHLTSIDISKCPNLRAFAPNDNDLEELDLSNNPLLDEVEINGNPRLKIVWLKKGQEIRHFIKDNHTEIRYKE